MTSQITKYIPYDLFKIFKKYCTMLEPWNDSSLQPPPVLKYSCKTKFDVERLKHICKNISQILSNQSPLHQEAAILSRLIYKYDKKFRLDIGFRNMKKTYTALKKYLQLNLLKDVDQYMSTVDPEEGDYVPTKQMLQYILLRIITFAKLMYRVNVCCKVASIFYLDRIKRGESHWMSLIPYAALCRIWSISTVLLHNACDWYKQLHSYLNCFELVGLPFLPKDYVLPEDLFLWLDIDNIDCYGQLNWAEAKKVQVLPILNDLIETDETFDIYKYLNNIYDDDPKNEEEVVAKEINYSKNNMEQKGPENIIKVIPIGKCDTGQALSRETYKLLSSTIIIENYDRNKNNTKHKHAISNVTNNHTLTEFINEEELLRNNNDEEALTKHLSFMQWQTFKRNALNLSEGIANRKLERKFNKLWKEKCLYYM